MALMAPESTETSQSWQVPSYTCIYLDDATRDLRCAKRRRRFHPLCPLLPTQLVVDAVIRFARGLTPPQSWRFSNYRQDHARAFAFASWLLLETCFNANTIARSCTVASRILWFYFFYYFSIFVLYYSRDSDWFHSQRTKPNVTQLTSMQPCGSMINSTSATIQLLGYRKFVKLLAI